MLLTRATVCFVYLIVCLLGSTSSEALEPAYETAPIFYSKTKAVTPLTKIQDRISKGEDLLSGKSDQDILVKLLKLLDVPLESQVLVYSKTSEQNNWISPQTPRALYFSDNAYIGWVQRGNIEVVTFDPKLGMVFHMLTISAGEENKDIRFLRKSSCLSCHGSSATDNWPGLTVRSVYSGKSGQPIFHAGTHRTDHSSPINQRWGGWYVTGDAGSQSHMGNMIASEGADRSEVYTKPMVTKPISTLEGLFPTEPYPGGAVSDIVALMVMEHQLVVHNALVQGNLVTLQTLYRHQKMRQAFGESNEEPLSETNQRIIDSQADKILAALLFKEEHKMQEAGVEGAIQFQEAFAANSRKSSDHRSLKDFRLYERLFKYRCSYLIYSDAFDHLPDLLKQTVLRKLKNVLRKGSLEYAFLGDSERQRIDAILTETLPSYTE